ncbi:MAG: DNA-3-methyladenine glycosylase I [Alistipes sp.]|nr:DNA-3-methyladenine glycosylase I [Alistipes sp.]
MNIPKNETGRCPWCAGDPLYTDYHDKEWGRPVVEERTLFEFVVLEGAQAGLSWITILRKREAYRKAFAGFDPDVVAGFTDEDMQRLLQDPGIVRNRLKIKSAVNNAKLFLEIQREAGSFRNYILSFFNVPTPIVNDIPDSMKGHCRNEISDAISKDLKKRGFTFFGTTICYSFLQATGFIDDHQNDCHFKTKTPPPSE